MLAHPPLQETPTESLSLAPSSRMKPPCPPPAMAGRLFSPAPGRRVACPVCGDQGFPSMCFRQLWVMIIFIYPFFLVRIFSEYKDLHDTLKKSKVPARLCPPRPPMPDRFTTHCLPPYLNEIVLGCSHVVRGFFLSSPLPMVESQTCCASGAWNISPRPAKGILS